MSNNLYNMWDSIQVEVGAEFEKTKLSLGELKQISEGLIVDIGSIYDNKIDLKVEDKIVASGELVIINDRYGVRINEIFTETDSTSLSTSAVTDVPTAQSDEEFSEETYEEDVDTQDEQYPAKETSAQNSEDDEFDYSNFDIDDEDL